MGSPGRMPRALILGCAGPELGPEEGRFFAAADPLGFILFARNCRDPEQVRRLVDDLRGAVGRASAPVLIDQEGGRVTRLGPPHWRTPPPAARFGELYRRDPAAGTLAAEVNARLIAADLGEAGIDVDCLPVLDLRRPETHEAIGDRAFDGDPEVVAALGRAVCRGLVEGGVLPVIKHVPGHGRARVDSHVDLPAVEADRDELAATDFAPFKALADMPWAMTAHVVYTAIDAAAPATVSATVIGDVIRGEIGFDGLLLSDDLSMAALSGDVAERAQAALAAGCDVALHCNGERAEMEALAGAVGPLSEAAERRFERGRASVAAPEPMDRAALEARLEALLAAPATDVA